MMIQKKYIIGITTQDTKFWNYKWMDEDTYLTKSTNKYIIYFLYFQNDNMKLSKNPTYYYTSINLLKSRIVEFNMFLLINNYKADVKIYTIYINIPSIYNIGIYRFFTIEYNTRHIILDNKIDSTYTHICDKCGIDLSDIDVQMDCDKACCPACKENKNHKFYQQIRDAQLALKLINS
ncbi:MAG: hypothetical protein WCX82_03500 [archaeon]|jgi:hypothetical protein